MSTENTTLAHAIIEHIGGKENVATLTHCATRLRFTVANLKFVQVAALESTPGVIKVFAVGDSVQIVIGPGVTKVYQAIVPLLNLQREGGQASSAPAPRLTWKQAVTNAFNYVSGSFVPIVPALCGAGMIKAVLAVLILCKLTTTDSPTYYVLRFFSDTVFYFLPVFLAYNAANKLKSSPALAMGTALMMMHPQWLDLVKAGQPVQIFEVLRLTLTNCGNTVIPILIIIWVQSYVERILNRLVADALKLVFVPLLTFLIVGSLAFSCLGPIGAILGGYLASFFEFLNQNLVWAPALLIGCLQPVLVMFGMHYAIIPIGLFQLAQLGYDSTYGPGALVSNMALATAGLVVFFRVRDSRTRQIASSAALSAYIGITEPLLYGINLPKKYPFIASLLGGAAGGLYVGLMGVQRFAAGGNGSPSILYYLDDSMYHFTHILIGIAIAMSVSAVTCYLLSFRYEREEGETARAAALTGSVSNVATPTTSQAVAESQTSSATLEVTGDQVTTLCAPLVGTSAPLEQASDAVFASGAMGEGIMLEPSEGVLYAPFDGEVVSLFPTRHALVLRATSGVEVLIHVGMDTVKLDGQGFTAWKAQGEKFVAGEKLLEFDLDLIRERGYLTQTVLVVTEGTLRADACHYGQVQVGQPLLQITA